MTEDATIRVRPWRLDDTAELLALMQGLAEFEGYADEFCVTADALREAWAEPVPPFKAFVAEKAAAPGLLGMAVSYEQPWTYDLRPTVVLKELFVRSDARGLGVGERLLQAVIDDAKAVGASRLNWTVLASNDAAKAFYRRLSGRHDERWEPWTLDLKP